MSEMKAMQKTIATLSGRIVRAETVNARLTNELMDLQSHSMKNNIIINFDRSDNVFKESGSENPIAVVRQFFSDVMGIANASKLSIPNAHRLGPNTGGIRAMIVKLPVAAEFTLVMSKAKSLKGTHHFISQQLPPGKRERKQFTLPLYKDVKQDKQRQARIVQDRLYVDGTLQRQFLAVSLPDVITTTQLNDRDAVILRSETIKDGGSSFTGFSAAVESLLDVRHVIDALLRDPQVAAAKHLIYAYRIETADGTMENFDSDNDFGVGLELLKAMKDAHIKNTLFVAARTCKPDYSHIGKKRFDHVRTLCMSAYNSG
jgi:hypothetical protein